ncbi:cell division protein FtsZ [Francisellaceae bacterium]|nr:cell division protein FtsZ [Francisellaceae bacterium]
MSESFKETKLVTSSIYDHGSIKVIGIGGAGGNTINHMVEQGIKGVEIYALNTDVQALNKSKAPHKLQIGEMTTKGLGAGADPNVGLMSAQESRIKIREIITGCDLLFITAGMGGGTGTGAAGVIAEEAKELGIVCVAVVSMPFSFEGMKRSTYARQGVQALQKHVNSLIMIPNDKLQAQLGTKVSLLEAFKASDDVLCNAISSISAIITYPGHINVDFADVRTVMRSPGLAMIGTAKAEGENRAIDAVNKALSCELLEEINLEDAKGLLVCVTANEDISLGEFSEIGDRVSQIAQVDAPVIIGTSIDKDMDEALGVTIVATGFSVEEALQKSAQSVRKKGGQALKEQKNVDMFKQSFNINTDKASPYQNDLGSITSADGRSVPKIKRSDIPVDINHFLKKK